MLRADVISFSVEQSVQLAADQYEVRLSTSQPFTGRAGVTLADLRSGLRGPGGGFNLVSHITDGVIDEYDMAVDPSGMTATVRGRDAMAAALDTALYISYGGVPPDPDAPPLPSPLAEIPGVTTVLTLPGTWRASAICRDLAQRVGLDCAYLAPDYTFKEPFDVSGSVLSAVQSVVAPFCHFEPFRVDIWVDGKTLMIRSRPGMATVPVPGSPVTTLANSIAAADLRASSLTFRAHDLDHTRIMRLIGAGKPFPGTPCSSIEETETEVLLFDKTGENVITRITERTTTRKPDNAVLKVVKETHSTLPATDESASITRLAAREVMFNEHDQLFFDEACNLLNSPKLHRTVVEVEAWQEDSENQVSGGSLQPSEEHQITYQYDINGHLTAQVTDKSTYDQEAKKFVQVEREVRRYPETGILTYAEVVDSYTAGESGWLHKSRSTNPAGGHRPGGAGRSLPSNLNDKNPHFIAEIVDNVPGAKDFSFTDRNFTAVELEIVAGQCRASSGAEEVEVTFTAANIPWLRRGQVLTITGLVDENSASVVLPRFMVFDNKIEFVESRSPQYISQVRAIGWTAEA